MNALRWDLVDYPSRNMEVSVVEGRLVSGKLTEEVSEKDFGMWLRDCTCDTLLKNMSDFCSCQKHLPEVKMKRFRLLARET